MSIDTPAEEQLLKVVRVASWEKAKAQLITLAATFPEGSVQHNSLCDVIDQFVNHVEENKLHR